MTGNSPIDSMLNAMFRSVIDSDRAAVVICGTDHTIVYMNPAAVGQYRKWGGGELVGRSLLECHSARSCELIERVVEWFRRDPANNMIFTGRNEKQNKDVYMVALRGAGGAPLFSRMVV